MRETPNGWIWARLVDAAEVIGRARAVEDAPDLPELTFRGVLANGVTVPGEAISGVQATAKGMTRAVPGDIVVTSQGHVSGWVGKKVAAIASNSYVASTLQVVRPHETCIDGRFLLHQLRSERVYQELQALAGARTSLGRKGFGQLGVLIAPLAEQRRIVEALEEQLSRLDAAEAGLVGAAQKRRAVDGLTLDRVLDARGPLTAIGDLVAAERKIAYGVLQPGDHCEGGVPLVRVGDIAGGAVAADLKRIDPAVAAQYPRTQLRGGEVLLTIVGTIGRTAVAPIGLAGANVARAVALIPVGLDADPRFVAFALGAPKSVRRLTGLAHEVARKTLNLEDVRKFQIPLPPLENQREIVASTTAVLSRLAALEHAITVVSAKGDALRRSILESAFRGELVPQDPSDDPASVLLERIADERAATSKPAREQRERTPA